MSQSRSWFNVGSSTSSILDQKQKVIVGTAACLGAVMYVPDLNSSCSQWRPFREIRTFLSTCKEYRLRRQRPAVRLNLINRLGREWLGVVGPGGLTPTAGRTWVVNRGPLLPARGWRNIFVRFCFHNFWLNFQETQRKRSRLWRREPIEVLKGWERRKYGLKKYNWSKQFSRFANGLSREPADSLGFR